MGFDPRREARKTRATAFKYPKAFQDAAAQALREMGWEIEKWGEDSVDCKDKEGEKRHVGLHNIYLRAAKADPSEWVGMIKDFIESLHSEDLDTVLDDITMEKAASRLLLRIGKPFTGE